MSTLYRYLFVCTLALSSSGILAQEPQASGRASDMTAKEQTSTTEVSVEEYIAALRIQLDEQRTMVRSQNEMLRKQQERLDRQTEQLERIKQQLKAMERANDVVTTPSITLPQSPEPDANMVAAPLAESRARDSVGDLNTDAVMAGDFPGSFRIPGPGRVSLAIGGFIKSVGIWDSDAEAMGADFLPATLGTRRSDEAGAFSLDATITRLHLDGRAPIDSGQVRGYVEYDLNGANDGVLDFKLRHAYGTWENDYGTLLVGQTWSTFMDVKILPEGLTEPTVSGPIFQRQSMIRWSQPLDSGFALHAAIEDPSSNDVFSDQPVLGNTNVPDGVLGLEYDHHGLWHLRLNGILRDIEVDVPGTGDVSETGRGLALTGHVNTFDRDRIVFSSVYGEGLGRYLLGIQSTAGGAIDPADDELGLRDNWGAMLGYQHHWTDTLRSSAMIGYANSEPLNWQPENTFESSTYGAINLMWTVTPYMTLGMEYGYGVRENRDGSDIDNHRIMFGAQIF